MKRFLTIFLALTCLTALFCPAFAAVECTVPPAGEDVAVLDVLVIGGGEGETVPPREPVEDAPADGIFEEQPVDGKYSTMGALYQAWGGWEGYPDYVCGVWSTDGGMDNLTVAVTKDEAGERGKAEILSQLKNHDTVTFTTQTYRYSELLQVMEEITAQMGGDSPIVGCGVYEMENKVGVTLLETAETAEDTAEALLKKYGDRITVEAGSMSYEATLYQDRGMGPSLTGIVLFVLLMTVGLTVTLRSPARVTNTGKVVAGGKPTAAQVESALRESTETPPDRVEDRIREQL